MLTALRIQVQFNTGARAAGIDPRNRNLRTHPSWQDPDNGVEIRLLVDGNPRRYEGKPGIQVLNGAAEIDAAVQALQRVEYRIAYEHIAAVNIAARNLDLDKHRGKKTKDLARGLFEDGVAGVEKIERAVPTAAELAERLGISG